MKRSPTDPYKEKETVEASQNSPLYEGRVAEVDSTNSPPYEGGVAEGRGGSLPNRTQLNNLDYLKPTRKQLRHTLTPAEATFWIAIKNGSLEGRKFRRQHSIGNYVLDFYCPSEKLAIELDGEIHFNDPAREADSKRTLYLRGLGIRVLRFENRLIFEDLEWVLGAIKNTFGWNKDQNERTTPPRRRGTPPS
jgi:very-short-patch-repair endonuclease